jgi:hypothetical protein
MVIINNKIIIDKIIIKNIITFIKFTVTIIFKYLAIKIFIFKLNCYNN